MKILSIQYGNIDNPYSHGGLAHLLKETFERMTPRQQITCFTGLLPDRSQSTEINGIKYIRKGLSRNKYINRLSFSLINSMFKPVKDFDLVLIPWDRYAPVLIDSIEKCPVILELNLDFFSIASKLKAFEPITRYFLKRNLKKSKYIISACEALKKIAAQYTKNARLFEVFPGGVAEEFLKYPVDPESEKYLLYIGRLDISHKGIDILLESYKAANIDLPLVIAGDGIDKIKVENLVKDTGLNNKVKTVGWVQGREKLELIGHCLAVCVPSRVEGWGIVASEAAAMGKPVIGTKVVGLEEAVIDGKTGILVPKDNIEEFSRAIKLLVKSKEMRRRLGKYAREIARQFTWEKIAARREDFFYRVIDDFRQEHPAPKSHHRQ
jgi:glycosyltransferase involved in cell wall biosynthesis